MLSRRLSIVAVVAVSLPARADTIYVDHGNCPGPGNGTVGDPYCSIQTAVVNAVDTDEIIVAPGTYFETIDFLGKAITLRSSDGAEVTTIDAQQTGTVVTCENGEGPDTVLEGFTITGGPSWPWLGGGMVNVSSSPTVAYCTFSGNEGDWGGGMQNWSSSPTVTNCTFSGNEAYAGGGMRNSNSNPTVIDCTFTGNSAKYGGGMSNSDS
ncbi:MAG: right-handed parallel beta-helix repeat-containing protein, partial [Planctomycetota bacterium]